MQFMEAARGNHQDWCSPNQPTKLPLSPIHEIFQFFTVYNFSVRAFVVQSTLRLGKKYYCVDCSIRHSWPKYLDFRKIFIATNFETSFDYSTWYNPNTISELDETERQMRRSDAPNKSPYLTKRTSREILVQEADIIDARMQILYSCDSEGVEK